jgi:hypothetical protein
LLVEINVISKLQVVALLFIDFESLDCMQVGEAIPLNDASVDAVVGTLVLCSVKEVGQTLQGNWIKHAFGFSQ